MRDALAKDRRISHEKQPEYGYARISLDLGDPGYVGTDIPLAFSGDQLAKIKYTGSNTGTYFRLNNRHAQQIFASEFKRSNIPYTKIYLTNPAAQSGKIFSFYIGTGIFAAIQPSGTGAGSELIGLTDDAGTTINPATEDKQDDMINWGDPDFPNHVRTIPHITDTDMLAVSTTAATDTISCAAGHHLEIFGYVITETLSHTIVGFTADPSLKLGTVELWHPQRTIVGINSTYGSRRVDIINNIRVIGANNTALTLTNYAHATGASEARINAIIFYKDITD